MKKALTIGVFDGVHRGHLHLFRHLLDLGCEPRAITFSNHPLEILKPALAPLPLTPLPLKLALLKESGIPETSVLDFSSDLARLAYGEFLDQYEFDHLVIGDDAAIGQGRLGTPDALRLYGLKRGAQIHIISKLRDRGEPISSSRIRALIAQGDLREAERLLGRPHCFAISRAKLHAALPPDGTYPVWAHSPSGIIPTTLTIQQGQPIVPLESPQLISFGPYLNPQLYIYLCHPTSHAAL